MTVVFWVFVAFDLCLVTYLILGMLLGFVNAIYGDRNILKSLSMLFLWPIWLVVDNKAYDKEMKKIAFTLTDKDLEHIEKFEGKEEREHWENLRKKAMEE